MRDNLTVRLYCDERTDYGKMVISLLQKYEIPFSTIPTDGLPDLRGPGALNFNFRCPTDRDEDLEKHILYVKNYILNHKK